MERIGVRQLRQHASRYLDEVKAGKTIEVTERGKLVALLVPPDPATGAREHMIATGQIIPASRPFRLPKRTAARADAPSVVEALDDLREDRL